MNETDKGASLQNESKAKIMAQNDTTYGAEQVYYFQILEL
jgi:hypothetical protein